MCLIKEETFLILKREINFYKTKNNFKNIKIKSFLLNKLQKKKSALGVISYKNNKKFIFRNSFFFFFRFAISFLKKD